MSDEKLAIRIRPATADDAGGLADVMVTVGTFQNLPADPAARVRHVAGNLSRLLGVAGHDLLVAELADGDLVGYLNMHRQPCLHFATPEGFISELFIHADFRGKGIGGQLLDQAEKLARERGWWRLHLVNNRERDSYRRKFYESRGWTERPPMADFVLDLQD
jgi:GNAT superfamily N-acetyltransferase